MTVWLRYLYTYPPPPPLTHTNTGRVVRQIIWSFISFSTGFYSANVVSLSFGAIAVNDVIAAVFTVAFVEIVSKIYYEADKVWVGGRGVGCFEVEWGWNGWGVVLR